MYFLLIAYKAFVKEAALIVVWMGQLSDTWFLPYSSMGETGMLDEGKEPPKFSSKHAIYI